MRNVFIRYWPSISGSGVNYSVGFRDINEDYMYYSEIGRLEEGTGDEKTLYKVLNVRINDFKGPVKLSFEVAPSLEGSFDVDEDRIFRLKKVAKEFD